MTRHRPRSDRVLRSQVATWREPRVAGQHRDLSVALVPPRGGDQVEPTVTGDLGHRHRTGAVRVPVRRVVA